MEPLNYVEIILLIIVIIIEIIILLKLPSEAKGRSKLIEDLKATRELFVTREDYHKVIAEQISNAQTEVLFLSASLPTSQEEPLQQKILQVTSNIIRRLSSYRGLVAKDPQRIRSSYEQVKLGVEIRFHQEIAYTDLTFTIIDKKIAVMGTPIQKGAPSTMGSVTQSDVLIKLLLEYFDGLWCSATNFKSFVDEVVLNMKNAGLSEVTIEKRIGIPLSELEKLQ